MICRNFPKSWSVLERYGGLMFEGHHRVGWNSYPNVMAILTGEAAYKPEEKPENGTLYIDEEFQFIQNTFQENGYLRLHLEDFAAWPNFFKPGPLSIIFNSLEMTFQVIFNSGRHRLSFTTDLPILP